MFEFVNSIASALPKPIGSEILFNLLINIILFFLGVFAKSFLNLASNQYKRFRGKDKYGLLYGEWRCYRRTQTTGVIIETKITIKRQYFSTRPICIFHSELLHPRHGNYGYCEIYSNILFFQFEKPENLEVNSLIGSSGTPFVKFFWNTYIHNGELKYGCGSAVANSGHLIFYDCILSRNAIESSLLVELLVEKTRGISVTDSIDKLRMVDDKFGRVENGIITNT